MKFSILLLSTCEEKKRINKEGKVNDTGDIECSVLGKRDCGYVKKVAEVNACTTG